MEMLEESASAIPSSIWASMNSWFTPTFLFLLLNLVIATIVFISTLSDQKHKNPQNTPHPPPTSSLLHRLKSISLNTHFRSQEPPNPHDKPDPDSHAHSHYFFPDAADSLAQAHYVFDPAHLDSDAKEPDSDDFGPGLAQRAPIEESEQQSAGEVLGQTENVAPGQFSRTKSDTEPASGVLPTKLPSKMRKSASLKSAFGHFEEEEEIVETRRPATVRERGTAKTADDDEEVDAKADDFINRFKQQLKLQRMDSIVRYKDMIGRGK